MDFQPRIDMEALNDYRWNDRVVNHLFCKTFGIYPYHGNTKTGYRVNLGCVEAIRAASSRRANWVATDRSLARGMQA